MHALLRGGARARRALVRAGWEDTRLLAPVAECSLLLTSAACILDTERLAALGLVLRSLCCLEVRHTRVREVHAMNYSPQHIVPGTSVTAVVAETLSGTAFPLVLGVPSQVCARIKQLKKCPKLPECPKLPAAPRVA